MKKEELVKLGLTEEQVKAVFALNGEDVNHAKTSVMAEKDAEIKSLTEQLSETQSTLKGFEGVNVEELQGKIKSLTDLMNERENQYKQDLADRDFNAMLDSSIAGVKGKNSKAIKALLDIDSLKGSKNQKEDLTAALEALKKENDYLFESKEPIKNSVGRVNQNGGEQPKIDSEKMALMRQACGLPPKTN